MKARFSLLSRFNLSIAFVVLLILMSAGTALAQSSDDGVAATALSGVVLLFVLAIGFAVYLYISLALQTIATKTGTPNAWLAWIPIVNIFLMVGVAKKPAWWFVLFLIPLVNIVISIIVWMAIAEARRKPNWWGILTIVPLVNVVVPGYLAWSD
jgi:hypothetical protein